MEDRRRGWRSGDEQRLRDTRSLVLRLRITRGGAGVITAGCGKACLTALWRDGGGRLSARAGVRSTAGGPSPGSGGVETGGRLCPSLAWRGSGKHLVGEYV